MNRMTHKDYQEYKNKTYTLISFDADGKRKLTYSGLPINRVVEESCKYTENGLVVKVYPDGSDIPTNGMSWDIEDYN